MEKSAFTDKEYLLQKQYADSGNLGARANLHAKYSQAARPWPVWVFDQLELQPGMSVLECGGGPGWLWRQNMTRLPQQLEITFTDFSPGMVAEAAAALTAAPARFHFQVANIEQLPFDDDRFDVVIANHMLYHVPDRPRALAEVRRVLRSHGRFFAATNGENHMAELQELATDLFPAQAAALQLILKQRQMRHQLSFRLENGRAQLAPYFADITLRPYADSLLVTDAHDMLDYIFSMIDKGAAIPADMRGLATAALQRRIEAGGPIHISKESGLFIAAGEQE